MSPRKGHGNLLLDWPQHDCSHVCTAEDAEALEEVQEVLGPAHRHRLLEGAQRAVAGQPGRCRAALSPDRLPQRRAAARAVKVDVKLHLQHQGERAARGMVSFFDMLHCFSARKYL